MPTEPNVKSFTGTDTNGRPVRFTVSTDIVDYIHSARAFGLEDLGDVTAHGRFQTRIVAIPDRAHDTTTPLVLTIGGDGGLRLVRRDAAAGWKLIDLRTAFPASAGAKAHTRAVAAAWTDDDRITIAVAVDDGTPGAPSRLLVAYDLSSKGTDWEKIVWTDCGTRELLCVEGLRVLDNGDRTWTTVLDCDSNRIDNLYLLRSDATVQAFNHALVFNTPVDYQEIHDFQAMVDPATGSGIAVLGESGRTTVLKFRPFPAIAPDGKLGSVPPEVPLPCPAGARVLSVSPFHDGGNDLYIGGQGVHLIKGIEFDNFEDAKVVEVIAPAAAPNVLQVEVAEAPDGAITVVAREINGDLVIGGAPATSGPPAFSAALRLRPGVAEFAAVHGDKHAVTSLLVVYNDGRASFLLQDAASRIWQERPLLVAAPEDVTKVSCYGTSLRVLDGGGIPKANVKVRISASMLTSATLNDGGTQDASGAIVTGASRSVFIGPALVAEANTDANGGITLYDRVRSLAPPVYRLEIDGFGEVIDVNPAGGIQEHLSKVTAKELLDAQVTGTGGKQEALLGDDFRTSRRSDVDAIATMVNRAASLATDTTSGKLPGVSLAKSGDPFSSKITASTATAGTAFAVQSDGKGGVRLAEASQVSAIVATVRMRGTSSIEDAFIGLGHSIADFFEGIWSRVKEAWTFIVQKANDAWEFICAVGDKIKRFVLNTLEEIGSFFTWLWDQVKVGLEKLWDFLKFIFNWDDILRARNVLVDATDEALKYLQSNIGVMKTETSKGIKVATDTIRQWQKDLGFVPTVLAPPPPGESMADRFAAAGSTVHGAVDKASGNSVISWVMERLSSFMDQIIHVEGPSPGTLALGAAEKFITGLAGGELDLLLKTWDQLKADIHKIVGDAMPDASLLSFETVRKMFIAIGGDAVVGLLEGVEVLVLRSLDLLSDMIGVMRAFLFARISFPFIEKLVALVSPNTKVDTSFRMVDAIMLLVAVPSTIAYKVMFNEAPFKDGDVIQLPFGRVTAQVDLSDFAGFIPYAGIAAAFFKLGKGVWAAGWALAGDYSVSKLAIVGGVAFGAIGLAAMVFGQRSQEGSAVSALDWCAIGAGAFGVVTSVALAAAKWEAPVGNVASDSHKLDAGVELVSTVAQIGVATAAFGVIIDRLRQSSVQYDQVRQMPESFKWIALLFDQAGTILFDVATFLAPSPPKLILVAVGAVGKGGAFAYKSLEVASTKLVLEPLKPK